MSPQRPSGRRFAAFVAALALCSSAFGAVVLPRLGDSSVPTSLKAKPKQTTIEQKHGRSCPAREREPGTT